MVLTRSEIRTGRVRYLDHLAWTSCLHGGSHLKLPTVEIVETMNHDETVERIRALELKVATLERRLARFETPSKRDCNHAHTTPFFEMYSGHKVTEWHCVECDQVVAVIGDSDEDD